MNANHRLLVIYLVSEEWDTSCEQICICATIKAYFSQSVPKMGEIIIKYQYALGQSCQLNYIHLAAMAKICV